MVGDCWVSQVVLTIRGFAFPGASPVTELRRWLNECFPVNYMYRVIPSSKQAVCIGSAYMLSFLIIIFHPTNFPTKAVVSIAPPRYRSSQCRWCREKSIERINLGVSPTTSWEFLGSQTAESSAYHVRLPTQRINGRLLIPYIDIISVCVVSSKYWSSTKRQMLSHRWVSKVIGLRSCRLQRKVIS